MHELDCDGGHLDDALADVFAIWAWPISAIAVST